MNDVAFSSSPSLFWLLLLIFGFPLVLWIGLASTLARRGEVDRPNRIAQWYGYSVCLVAVVVLLISASGVVNALFTLASPLHGENDYGPALTSFEAYRATHLQSFELSPEAREALRRSPPTEAELRTRYQALRDDRIARNRHQAQRSLVGAGLMIVITGLLFAFHWRWLQRLARAEPAPSAA